jgi:SAM-dependent methyltransferase
MIWELLIVLVLVAAAVFMVYQNFLTLKFAPWVPSYMGLLRQALTWIKPTAGQTFIDLGCGDGRAVLVAAKDFRLEASGVDINPVLTLMARILLALQRQKGRIITGSLYQQNLNGIDIVYIYGLPEHIAKRLNKKLDQELRPGAWIISYNFSLPDRQPVHTITNRWRKIMIYRIKN